MYHQLLYYGIIVPFSKLPLSVLYVFSDLLYFVLNRIAGYRKAVIYGNIRRSFPDKSEREVKAIQNEFYRHFCDLIVETLKGFSISEEEGLASVKIINPEVIDRLYDKGKHVTAVGGHNGNWEYYAMICSRQIKADAVVLYTPMSSKFFDKIMRDSRSKFGLQMVSTRDFSKMSAKIGKPTLFVFAIDQCPKKSQRAYWMNFLNQETAVQYGAEVFARRNDTAVVFGNIRKVKRGHYEVEYTLLCEEVKDKPEGWIIDTATRLLERAIAEQPPYWLWSHKRWKYKKSDVKKQKFRPTIG